MNASTKSFLIAVAFLTFIVSCFWISNIIILRFQEIGLKRNLISYGVMAIMMVGFIILFHYKIRFLVVSDTGIEQDNFVYPFLNGFALNTIILIISHAIIIQERKRSSDNKIIQLESINKEAQQELLMQQFQPHFLFNALSTLKSLIRKDAEQAEEYILKLSDFLRFSIQAHKDSSVTVKKELKFATEYLEMQQIRFVDSIDFKIDVSDEVLEKRIPVFALQSLVENAFKHNTFSEENPLQISILSEKDRFDNYKIRVLNNKSLKRQTEKSGTGLVSLNQRFELLTNKSIEITENKDNFCVTPFLIA